MLVLTSSAFAQRIAVLNFNAGAGVKQNEVDGLSAIFGTYFKPKGAKFIERTRVDKVLQEYKMQKSILTNTDMVAMGEQLNASLVVVGDVTIMLGEYNIDVRVVNVQTAEVVAGDGISFDTNTSPRTTMQHLGERLSKSVELEIEKFKIEEKVEDYQSKDGGSTLPKNMTTKITEDNGKRDRTDVVVLYDYLKLYPKDLGDFREKPSTLIKQINDEISYGYDSWRLPTQEEIDIIRSDGYLSGLKYMTQSDPRGVLLLVTTKDPVVHRPKLPIAKQDISIHGGIGLDGIDAEEFGGSIGIKYRYKPFEKYAIRLLGEIGVSLSEDESSGPISFIPILVGINYEYKFNEVTSIWGDLGFGISIPLVGYIDDYWHSSHSSSFDRSYKSGFKLGFALSPEVGKRYKNFSLSAKYELSLNECRLDRYAYWEGGLPSGEDCIDEYHGNYLVESAYLVFRLGYHF